MELIGIKVKHITLGTGIIIGLDNGCVTVEFTSKTSKFEYPAAFDKFIKAENSDIQAAIIQLIADAKKVEEQRKRDEEASRRAAIEKSEASKKTKTLDEMFAPDYHAEKLARQPILTYEQVEQQFGIRISGFGRGINPTPSTVVLISSINKSAGNFVYHDRWTAEGDYIYSGEGRIGYQQMTKGNMEIRDAARNGKIIHLFVKFSPKEYYYQGVFELVEYTYEYDKDQEGNDRKEYKFRLRKVFG